MKEIAHEIDNVQLSPYSAKAATSWRYDPSSLIPERSGSPRETG
jgi:hypothetical protein